MPEKKDACNVLTEPLAAKVHIHAKVGDTWILSSVDGKPDTYTIRSVSSLSTKSRFNISKTAGCTLPYSTCHLDIFTNNLNWQLCSIYIDVKSLKLLFTVLS